LAGRHYQAELGNEVILHYEYDRSGLLVAARNDYQSVRLVYDDLGRVVAEVQGDFGVKSAYDARGNLAQLETTWETLIQLAYDAHDQLRQVVFPHGQVVEYHRDALGRPSERRLPGGITSRCEHDLRNRLVAQRVYRGDKLIVERYYEYDTMGRLVRCEGSQPRAYEYDKAGQLIAAHYPNGEEHFQYDAAGDRETVSTDECGRVAGRGADRYYYDVFNQLVRIERGDGTTIHYRYDALGRRISKQIGTQVTRWVWHEFQLLGEETAGVRTQYVCYPQQLLPLGCVVDDSAYFYQLDQLGTVREVTDEAGELVWQGQYRAFGECAVERRIEQPWRLPGQYFDAESGLHYNLFRYYDPLAGRYVTPDPVSYFGGDVNLYRYARNDPVNRRDVLGLTAITAGDIGGKGGAALCSPGGPLAAGACYAIGFWVVAGVVAGLTWWATQSAQTPCQGCEGAMNNEGTEGEEVTDENSQATEDTSGENASSKGKKATDSGKNEPHGDFGRRQEKANKQIEELEKQLEELNRNQGSRAEKTKIKNKIDKIKKAADKAAKGETHGRRGK
jgi:RHS repeat-associated protein